MWEVFVMERDYGKEIDEIRNQLSEIKDLLAGRNRNPGWPENPEELIGNEELAMKFIKEASQKLDEGGHVEIMTNMDSDPRLSTLMADICRKTNETGSTGTILHMGVFASGNYQSNWLRQEVNVDLLLQLIENNVATKVLACIGSNDRLNLLLALLRTPRTTAQLVEQCGFNTTGQVYHHLKPLLAADLVAEDKETRGMYKIQPHRVSGIIMLLAGISDMLDTSYTRGEWEG